MLKISSISPVFPSPVPSYEKQKIFFIYLLSDKHSVKSGLTMVQKASIQGQIEDSKR